VIELIGGLDGLAKRQVTWQDDVFTLQRDDEGALHRPRAYSRDGGELGHQLLVRQAAQRARVQPAVRHPPGQVPERADLPPREPGRAELLRLHAQQVGGCRKTPAEHGLDARQGPPGRRDGQLLPGDLEQQGTEQIHRRQLGYPRPGIEIRTVVDELRQHRVGVVQVRACPGQPRGTAGILGHRVRSFLRFLRPGTPVIVFMITGRQVNGCHLILMNHHDPVMASHLDGSDRGLWPKLARPPGGVPDIQEEIP
jgi:hypothetical protein